MSAKLLGDSVKKRDQVVISDEGGVAWAMCHVDMFNPGGSKTALYRNLRKGHRVKFDINFAGVSDDGPT